MSNFFKVFALISIALAGASVAQAAPSELRQQQAQTQAFGRDADFNPADSAVCRVRAQRYRCDEFFGGAGVDG